MDGCGPRPTLIISSLTEACAALLAAAALRVPVRLRSTAGASAFLGARVFVKLAAAARDAVPAAEACFVLDCGDNAMHAIAAFRAGVRAVRVGLREPARSRVADIAQRMGCVIDIDDGPLLDLSTASDPLLTSRKWLAKAQKCGTEAPRPRCQGTGAGVSQSGLLLTKREIEA